MKKSKLWFLSVLILLPALLLCSCHKESGDSPAPLPTVGGADDSGASSTPGIQEQSPYSADTKVFNVISFGAKGDGRANDADAIEEAIAAAVRAGGGTVYFPSGTYKIERSLVIASDQKVSLTLLGETGRISNSMITSGRNVDGSLIEIRMPGVALAYLSLCNQAQTGNVLHFSGTDAKASYCSFSGTAAANDDPLILVSGSRNTIYNCGFNPPTPTVHAIRFTKYADKEAKDNAVTNCHWGGERNAVLVDSEDPSGCQENLTIAENVFLNYSETQTDIRAVKGCVIKNNMYDQGALYCMYFKPEGVGISGMEVYDNYIAAAYQYSGETKSVAILMDDAGGGRLEHVSFTYNFIGFSGRGIVVPSDAFSNITIAYNQIGGMAQMGIEMPVSNNNTIRYNTFGGLPVTIKINEVKGTNVIQYNTANRGTLQIPSAFLKDNFER